MMLLKVVDQMYLYKFTMLLQIKYNVYNIK